MIKHLLPTRGVFVALITYLLSSTCLASAQHTNQRLLQEKLIKLEADSGGRLGLFAINTADNTWIQYRAKERFPLCSTGKVIAVSAILKQSMKNPELLHQTLFFSKKEVDVAGYAPVTQHHLKDGMTIDELCKATMTQSDNAAMNGLMRQLGGPAYVTAFAQSIGDTAFTLERWEPALNSAIPGDLRDTTTPLAMAQSLQRLVLGDILAKPQRMQLQAWLKSNTTGNNRIRAGTPHDWVVGDKTGTGEYGTTNDIGIMWPPKGAPIVIAIYFTQNKKDAKARDDVIASVTRLLINSLKRH